MNSRITKILAAACLFLMGICVGMVVTYDAVISRVSAVSASNETTVSSNYEGADKYNELMTIIDQYYIGDDPDMTYVNDCMANAVVSAIGDRWSYYISAEDYQNYLDNLNNSYVGVGITISAMYDEDNNMLGYEVIDVTEDGPADEAGVLAGDVLTAVDGTSVIDISLTDTKNLVKGEEGTKVNLTFLRGDAEITLPVTRSSFTVSPAEGKLLNGDVGYIIIDNFDSGCSDAVIGLIEDLQEQGATKLLFDVRSNPGGMKTELTALLDYLLPEGTIFHSVDYTGAEEYVTSDASCVDMPMAVLVNADSYSAAEYFACALQEYGVATIIGEKTCGKGYFQIGIRMNDGSCVNLSVGKYYTPNGISLIDVGVTPDIEISLDDELSQELAKNQLDPDVDPQIQAALEALN